MTQIEFLSRILPPLPPAGLFGQTESYYAVSIEPKTEGKKTYITQYGVASLQSIADKCMEISNAGNNAYMALSSFNSPTARTQANAREEMCLWADIDAGKKDSVYANAQEALTALTKFVRKTGLKPSIVVSSGKGLHVYWCFSKPVAASLWNQLAFYFHNLCRQEDLDVDTTRAEDTASVLRMPGTKHVSSGNTVTILLDSPVEYAPRDILQTIHSQLKDKSVKPVVKHDAPKEVSGFQQAMDEFGLGDMTTSRPARPEPVVYGCAQMLGMGTAMYPQWFAAMAVLRRCDHGLDWAHKLSAMDATRYEPDDTERKFYMASEDSPTLCATFERINPTPCATCRFKGRVKTPLQLQYVNTDYAAVQVEGEEEKKAAAELAKPVDHIDLDHIYTYPRQALRSQFFSVDHRGIVMHKAEKQSDGSYQTVDKVICESQLYFKYSVYYFDQEGHNPRRSHVFDVVHPSGKTEELTYCIDNDYGADKVAKWFANANMFPTAPVYGGTVFMNFMNAYLGALHNTAVELSTFDKFGWQVFNDPKTKEPCEGFVVGDGVITDDGIHNVRFASPAVEFTTRELTHAGNMADWKYGVNMYKTLNQYIGQFAICMSFAAPLMRYASGEASSAILSIYSAASGLGKTQLLRAAASVWGNPYEQFISRSASSVARTRKMAILKNLPVFMDEMTDVNDDDLYGLAYTLAGGKEKDKLKSSGAAYVKTGSWSTVSFISANKSMKAAISKKGGDSEATVVRLVEYECDFKSYEDQPKVNAYINECSLMLKRNYGLAGPEFMYQVLRRPDRLRVLTKQIEHWIIKNKFPNKERFTSNAIALALWAGNWAVEFGILDFDMEALEKWVLEVLVPKTRAATEEYSPDFKNIITTYLMERQKNTLIVTSAKRGPKQPDPKQKGAPDSYVVSLPPESQNIMVRITKDTGTVLFVASDFREWCRKRNASPQAVFDNLKKEGIHITEHVRNVGQNISWIGTVRSRCFYIDEESVKLLGYVVPESEDDND